jgi:hypothetical protein
MTTDEIQELKERLKNKKQPWTQTDPAKPEVRSAFAPMKPTVITKPADKPAAVEPAAKPVVAKLPSAPKTPIQLAAAVGDVRLEVQSKPQRGGLGSVFPLRAKDGSRVVIVQLFRDRLAVEQALARNDTVVLRLVASTLFIEWLMRSGCSKNPDVVELFKALVLKLGVVNHWTNVTYWVARLAEHELSAGLDAQGEKSTAWFTLEGQLPNPPCLWPWDPNPPKPERKPKKAITPEGEPK